MSIQWGRVVLAAFLMEVVLVGVAVPLFLSGAGRTLVYVIPPLALIATYAVTVWLGRGIKTNFVLHGVLIGIVGTLMYIALTRAQPEPWQYWLAHALKVVGGAAAGVVLAGRQTTPNLDAGGPS
jgi:hypothetical protein